MKANWIPCSERLPEIAKSVLVTSTWPDGQRACHVSERMIHKWTNTFGAKVVAWMPLPEPYKEDKENES